MIHDTPPRSRAHRERCFDSFGFPRWAVLSDTQEQMIRGTLAYQLATLRDHLSDVLYGVRRHPSSRRPW